MKLTVKQAPCRIECYTDARIRARMSRSVRRVVDFGRGAYQVVWRVAVAVVLAAVTQLGSDWLVSVIEDAFR